MTRFARSATLRRLAQVVVSEPDPARPAGMGIRTFERFLPQAVLRDMRLLNINLTSLDGATIAAAYILGTAIAVQLVGLISALAVAVAVCVVCAAALNILANRRINELGALMPGFFDRVRQLLVVGNSLPTAFARALHAGQPRLVTFFGPALRRVANGAGFSESIRQSAEDVSLYEMHLFSAAVSTNMRFGGSLTHSLSNLIQFLRKRASIERELRASTALIRSSAWVLGLLPVLVATLIVSQNREYARWFVTDPVGEMLLAYCIASQILGVIVMRLVIRTEF
jgi:tight adherence protein B